MKTPATCHPERPNQARGLCWSCYIKDWHASHPGRQKEYTARYNAAHPNVRRAYYERNAEQIAVRDKARRRRDPSINSRRVASKYGLTIEQREALLARPCEICGGVATDIDHDHATNAVRGALCGPCNSGIGQLGDDAERVAKAAAYLASRAPLLAVA